MRIWDGRYRIERTLGEGGMGHVVLAKDLGQGQQPVAVKLLNSEHRDQTTDFMREYAVQRRLDHPAIPRVHAFGFGEHNSREVPYFVMDFVRGIPLANALLTLKDPKQAWPWILQTLRALDHMHDAGFLHRDLKPGNILVSTDVDIEASAHLIDFGIAIGFGETPEELFIGTPEYSAPELMAGSPFDVRQDLYAIGLLVYEILTGHRPWPGDDPTDLYHKRMYTAYQPIRHPDCGPALAKLVDDLLKPMHVHRPRNAAEVIARFCDAVGLHEPIETPLAFRRRLQALPFANDGELARVAGAWLGVSAEKANETRPIILIVEDPRGFDGSSIVHQLSDRAAVAGSRIIRYSLEHRPHGPLEALEPALAQLRLLREQKLQASGRAIGPESGLMGGLAGAATLLTRLQGPTVLAIDGLEWADTLSLEILITVLTGAKNPGLRVIGTLDPQAIPAAERAFQRLGALPFVARVKRAPMALEAVTDWVDQAVGADLVPDARVLHLWKRSEGRPERVRELLADDLRKGLVARGVNGYRWDEALAEEERLRKQATPTTAPSAARAATGDAATPPFEKLLEVLTEPVPESVLATFLQAPKSQIRTLVADQVLAREVDGSLGPGPRAVRVDQRDPQQNEARQVLHERLARCIELSLPFDAKAERAAREWLRTGVPLRAVPHLLDAAHQALDRAVPRNGTAAPNAARLLDEVAGILKAAGARPTTEQVRLMRIDLGRARVRLAQLLGDPAAWEQAATELFARGLEDGHLQSMAAALVSLVKLAADRSDRSRLLEHQRALADLAPEHARFPAAWIEARLAADDGHVAQALGTLRKVPTEVMKPEDHVELVALEADILVQHGWLGEAETAVAHYADLARRIGDREMMLHARLLRASLAREGQAPDIASGLVKSLAAELGDARHYRLDGRLELERARCDLAFGGLDRAFARAAEAQAFARRDGDRETEVFALCVDARGRALAGEHGRASEAIALALDHSARGGLSRLAEREVALTALEVGRARPLGLEPQRVFGGAQELARQAERDGQRSLTVRALALGALASLDGQRGLDALALAEAALERSTAWGGVGESRHHLLFLLARARFLRREGFRARRLLGEARTHLRSSAKKLADPTEREAFLGEPRNALIEAGALEDVQRAG